MRKRIFGTILQFIAILLLAVGITLNWIGYVYEGMPLVSAICLTIVNVILLLFHATEYVIVNVEFMRRQNETEENNLEVYE